MKRLLFLSLLLGGVASATTTVTGTLQNLGTGAVGSNAFVRFWLRGCSRNQPRITGTSLIGPTQGGVDYFDFAANGSGLISGTLYSTRDAAGTGNGEIECGGSYTAVWYGMQTFVGGKGGPQIAVHAKKTGTLDVSNVTPITVNPVITAPTADSTYLRIDGGNSPVTGPVTLNAGGTLLGTFGGNHTISGNETQTGNTLLKNLNNVAFADQYGSVQLAAAAVAASGAGGTVFLQCNTTYPGPPAAAFSNGVKFLSLCPRTYTTVFSYGSSSLYISGTTGLVIEGVQFSFSGAAGLTFNTLIQGRVDAQVVCQTAPVCVSWTSTAIGNSVSDIFDYLDITTGGPIGMQWNGGSDSSGTAVTDSHFRLVNIHMTRASLGAITEAIGFTKNCDSNKIEALHLFFTNVNAGNGIVWNDSATPGVDTDADNIEVTADITSGISITGTAYQVNKSSGAKWTEGFGATSFTIPVGADSNTHFFRQQLAGAGFYFGRMGIISDPGATTGTVSLPSQGSFIISDTAVQTMTSKTLTRPSFATGVDTNGSGFKHGRIVASCATAAAVGATCTNTLTWPSAFADTNYTVSCMGGVVVSGVPLNGGATSILNSAVTFQTVAATAVAAQYSQIDCIAVHD
jgi:hypothetical protein